MVKPPSSKITASMVAGALTVIIVAEAQRRGYPIDGTEGASISVVLSAIAGYLMPHSQAQAQAHLRQRKQPGQGWGIGHWLRRERHQ